MFLTENNNHNDIPISTSNIMANEAGMLDIMLEGAMFFHNLDLSMIKLEHASILQENAVLLEKGLSEYWTSFIKFMKEQWAKVKKWFAEVIERIKGFLSKISLFRKKYDPSKDFEPFELNCYDVTKSKPNIALTYTSRVQQTFNFISSIKDDTKEEEFGLNALKNKVGISGDNGITTAIKDECLGSDAPKEVTISKTVAQQVDGVLKKVEGEAARIEALQKNSDKEYSECIKMAEEILRTTGAGHDKQKNGLKKQILATKNLITISNQVYAGAVAGVTALMSECVKIMKAVIVAQNKKKPKDDKKNEDNILSQFGFSN